ncbi:MAG: hypothetical protein GY861_14745 [bacterium]|nr:hypothetical protein [bacterium]
MELPKNLKAQLADIVDSASKMSQGYDMLVMACEQRDEKIKNLEEELEKHKKE